LVALNDIVAGRHRERVERRMGSMPKQPSNAGRPWTPDQVRQLKSLVRENTPTRVIGIKLERTPGAIASKAAAEGISLKPTNKSPYNRSKQ